MASRDRAQHGLLWLAKNRPRELVLTDDLEAAERAAPLRDGDTASPEALLIATAETARLEAVIATLPLPFREALVLREIQGATYREIAAITLVPIGTVMSRLARARAMLIAALAERPI